MKFSIKDIIAPFAVWKRTFQKPYTVKNPLEERPGAPRYRGFHKNDQEKCIGCGTCETICQNAAIDMVPVENRHAKDGDSGLRPQIDYGRCCWCALCVDICTTGSLTMSNEYQWVDTDPDVFRFIPGHDEKSWNDAELGYKRDENYRLLNPKRADMEAIPGKEAASSFIEMVKGFSKDQALFEAQRCVQCGLCTATCPAHMDIPGYIKAIREGDVETGLKIMYETNPFPASCGRICTHRCEEVCALGHTGDAIAIRWLKRYIADQIDAGSYQDLLPQPMSDREKSNKEKSVAIIGAGPGGLAAAYYLRLMEYRVELYEAAEKGGGMLRYGIPEYRLPHDQLDKDIDYIVSLGVAVNYNTKVGTDISFAELTQKYDALFFSTGLPVPYSLGIEGEDMRGVRSGIDILDDITNGKDPKIGKTVAVVGGGNVAMDAARSARRFGAEVTVLYRRREVDMPADNEEIFEAKEENVTLITQAIPIKVETAPGNKIKCIWGKARMVDQGPGKRPKPELIKGDIHEIIVDTLISAIGQGADFTFIPEDSAIEMQRYKIVTDKFGRTTDPKVFAGGDIINNRKDAISAIADGHLAARGIDQFLQGGK